MHTLVLVVVSGKPGKQEVERINEIGDDDRGDEDRSMARLRTPQYSSFYSGVEDAGAHLLVFSLRLMVDVDHDNDGGAMTVAPRHGRN
ncbi:hypothetical protein CFC21_034943 [Triticum aestivum]|uniref:Uncharacterized protein n=3 Tax=Triticum TaxID=4564 RepID=A0A9R0RH94_TRITD|nr:hypothetical protein CFC21_034943 [Triticum aestivum]VAH59644.1 unnamed protein product [Triticum turgidum subsp. durum]